MGDLARREVGRVLVEGGARVHGAFLRDGLADQVSAFVAPLVLGGADAVGAVCGTGVDDVAQALRLHDTTWRRVGTDVLVEGYVAP
jgi:diaminohydroxyphosphoribosylaminopyrimidine deaminase/5-amino-6-(5-phosphoribosylamino)uracil reductase